MKKRTQGNKKTTVVDTEVMASVKDEANLMKTTMAARKFIEPQRQLMKKIAVKRGMIKYEGKF